ncbi:MAG: ATP-dependent RecD-like DNA helicase [Gemmatimonadetes bacterium]|nr:ATP-dependent RecD-like DNA helicase [Gemmatimonadota bacterium]
MQKHGLMLGSTAFSSGLPPKTRISVELSPDQKVALEAIETWFRGDRQEFRLAGLAGTGKTTIIAEFLKRQIRSQVSVCALAGKAASVLRSKGISDAQTIHSLIYISTPYCQLCNTFASKECKTRCGKRNIKTIYTRVPMLDCDLVIVDEASMVNSWIYRDLVDLAPKLLFVGDHGQLEPIGDNPRLMQQPDIRLETIHRQASGSPILEFAHYVRQSNQPGAWDQGDIVRRGFPNAKALAELDMVLCGYNKTRVAVNRKIREVLGFTADFPEEGERLVCLQNNRDFNIFNGMLVTVSEYHGLDEDGCPVYTVVDDTGDAYAQIPMVPDQFHRIDKDRAPNSVGLFDYGYCLTCHKAQGSEWERVAVLEQIGGSWRANRWRYTAATRASQELQYWLSPQRN